MLEPRRLWPLTLVAAVVVAVDQVSKVLLEPQGAEHYGSVLTTHNAFGVTAGLSPWSVAVRVALVVVVVWAVRPGWAAGLLVGGVVGNLIDTVLLGGVEDVLPIPSPWGIIDTNIADLAWLAGLVAVLVLYMRKGVSDGQDQDQAGEAGRGRRLRAGNRSGDLPAHDPVGPSKHLDRDRGDNHPQSRPPIEQQPKEQPMPMNPRICRRCGAARARDGGVCLTCKADRPRRRPSKLAATIAGLGVALLILPGCAKASIEITDEVNEGDWARYPIDLTWGQPAHALYSAWAGADAHWARIHCHNEAGDLIYEGAPQYLQGEGGPGVSVDIPVPIPYVAASYSFCEAELLDNRDRAIASDSFVIYSPV